MFNIHAVPIEQLIALSVCFALLLGILIYSWKEWRWEKRSKFCWIFEVEVPGRSNRWAVQSIIDKQLIKLAIAFSDACDNEKKFFMAYGSTSKDRVKFAKKRFWEAHNLAKSLGFVVKKSYKFYLPI